MGGHETKKLHFEEKPATFLWQIERLWVDWSDWIIFHLFKQRTCKNARNLNGPNNFRTFTHIPKI